MYTDIIKLDKNLFLKYKNDIYDCLMDLKNNSSDDCNVIINNMLTYINDNSAIIFASVIDNKLIGFIWGYEISEDFIHVNYFVVRDNYRNYGIGKKLLNRIVFEKENYNFELLVKKNNLKAIKFYENNGFFKQIHDCDNFKMILER